jgi:hypothetical protein
MEWTSMRFSWADSLLYDVVQGRYKPERPDGVLVLLTVLKSRFCSWLGGGPGRRG